MIPEEVQAEYLAAGYSRVALAKSLAVDKADGHFLVAVADHFADPDTATAVASDGGGQVVGFAQLQIERPLAAPPAAVHAHLHRLYVDPAAHRRGVGRQLIEAGVAAVRQTVFADEAAACSRYDPL